MNAAQLLRQIRKHEHECQGRCPACQAKLDRQREEIARQLRAEEAIQRWLSEQQDLVITTGGPEL